MSRRTFVRIPSSIIAAAIAIGFAAPAWPDDSSLSRFGGDSYAYFNRPTPPDTAANFGWRQAQPNGLTERELQALSSSELSALAAPATPLVFARAPADPTWRQTHPNGLTERELQALSSSALALWQGPASSTATAAASNLARREGSDTPAVGPSSVARASTGTIDDR